MISAKEVNELRKTTGAGMMDCKKALEATNGDMNAAMDWLREKGIAKANKKEARIAAEGLSTVMVEGNNAVIVEVNSETDFVSLSSKTFFTSSKVRFFCFSSLFESRYLIYLFSIA